MSINLVLSAPHMIWYTIAL